MRLQIAVLAALTAGCVTSSVVPCDDGTLCPPREVCDPVHGGCIAPERLLLCASLPDGEACDDDLGTCHDGLCLATACGNGRVDHGEVCDDGNVDSGDGCAGDCRLLEVCGNAFTEYEAGETCDEGDALGNDGCSSRCDLETPAWARLELDLERQDDAAVAYDPVRGVVVMFGGRSSLGVVNARTREWRDGTWRLLTPTTAPSSRERHAMTYDLRRREVLLFGGAAGVGELADTWAWDGRTWRLLDAPGPSARSGHAFAYDPIRGVAILHGGTTGSGALADTWELDSATRTWRSIEVPHPPTASARWSATFDPRTGHVLFTDGATVVAYDGTDFTSLPPPPNPSPVAELAFEVASQQVVWYGGGGTTWKWDGTSWLPGEGFGAPTVNAGFDLCASPEGGVLLVLPVFYDKENVDRTETWVLRDHAWQHAPLPVMDGAIALDTKRRQLVVYSGLADATFVLESDRWRVTPGLGVPKRDARLAYDAARARVVLFGGGNDPDDRSTWTFDGTGWEVASTAGPPNRGRAAMAYDAVREVVIMFGGVTVADGQVTDETWAWDGVAWTQLAPGTKPSPRQLHSAAYDPIRRSVVVGGGFGPTGTTDNDFWAWDGTTWSLLLPDPSVDWGSSLAFNPARGALVAGGSFITGRALEIRGPLAAPILAPSPPTEGSPFWFPALDGSGVEMIQIVDGQTTPRTERWQLAWGPPASRDTCTTGFDGDGDGLVGCQDPDCWTRCTPECPPGASCDPNAPHCGDAVCGAVETHRSCPADCTGSPACGDAICDPGETCAGDCS